jgi:hypothetical protein
MRATVKGGNWMTIKTARLKALLLVVIAGVCGCRLIAGTVVLATAVVVGTVGLAGYTVYKGGEAVVSGVGSVGSSTKQAVASTNEAIVVSRGTLKAKCKHSVTELYPAAETALWSAGFTGVAGSHDALTGALNARTSLGKNVIVGLKLIDKDRTAVTILVGDGDLRQSEYLYDQMLVLVKAKKGEV